MTMLGRRSVRIGVALAAVAGAGAVGFQFGRAAERADENTDHFVVNPSIDYGPLLDHVDRPLLDTPLGPIPPSTERVDHAAGLFGVWLEPKSRDDRVLRSFGPDGELLELHGLITDAGPEDIRVLRLSVEQRAEVASRVRETGAADLPTGELGVVGDGSRTLQISIDGVRSVRVGSEPPDDGSVEAGIATLINDLFDLSWLDPNLESAFEPWTPPWLTLWVDPGEVVDDDGEPAVPWPLDGPVLETTEGVSYGPFRDQAPYRCLYGEDAAAVFGAVDGRHAVVDDRGTLRRVVIEYPFPFHVAHEDRCG